MRTPAPDSTTTIDSPLATLSPGLFSHVTILPSVIVEDRAGMNTSLTARKGASTGLLDAPTRGPGLAASGLGSVPAHCIVTLLACIARNLFFNK